MNNDSNLTLVHDNIKATLPRTHGHQRRRDREPRAPLKVAPEPDLPTLAPEADWIRGILPETVKGARWECPPEGQGYRLKLRWRGPNLRAHERASAHQNIPICSNVWESMKLTG